jgi:TP901 family phage tail tape measure protein
VADVARLLLLLTGNAEGAVAALGETDAALKEVGRSANESNGFLGGLANGFKALVVGTVAVGAVIAAVSTKFAADFQQGTTRLITNAGETRDAVENIIKPALLDMAVTTGYSTEQLVEGFRVVSSAGYKAAEGVKVLTVSAEGARAEQADLGVVLNAVTSILNAYNLKADDAGMVMNTLTLAMQSGKLTLQDLSNALGTVIPAAANANINIQELTSALATMANEGIKPANAATYLRFTILNLQNATPKARKELEAIGLSADSLSRTLTTHGLGAALEVLDQAIAKKFPSSAAVFRAEMAKVKAGTEDMDTAMVNMTKNSPEATAALSNITGGIRGAQGALALGGAHLSGFISMTKDVTDKVRLAGHEIIGWREIQDNMNFQLSRAKEALELLAISLGTKLLPYATMAFKVFADWAPSLVALPGQLQAMATVVAQAVGPWAALVLHMTQSLGPFGWFLGPGVGVAANLRGVRDMVKLLSDEISVGAPKWLIFEDALQQIGFSADRAGEIGSQFRSAWAAVHPLLSTLATVIRGLDSDIRIGVPFWMALENTLMRLGMGGKQAIAWGYELRQIWEAIQRAGRQLWEMLGHALGPALTQFARDAGPLWKQLRETWESLKPILAAVGVVLGIIAAVGMALLVGVVKGLIMALGVVLPDAVHFLITALMLAAAIIKLAADIIVGSWRLAMAIFKALIFGDWKGLWETAKDVLGKIAGDIGNIVGDLMDLIGTIVHTGVMATYWFFWGLVSGVVGFFQWLFQQLVGGSIVPDLVNAIIQWILRLDSMVIAIIRLLVNTAIAVFMYLWNAGVSGAQALANGVFGALQWMANAAGSAVDWLRQNVLGRLSSLIGDAISYASSVGSGIANGIANGIRNGASVIINAARSAAQSALNAAKNLLGITSPSTVMAREVGLPTAQGVALGIDQGASQAQNALGRLVRGLSQGVTGAALATSADLTAKLSSSISNTAAALTTPAAAGGTDNADILDRLDRTNQLLLAIARGKSNVNGFAAALRQG